jgi:hypothetical protein
MEWTAHGPIIRHNRFRPFPLGQIVVYFEADGRELNMPGSLQLEHQPAAHHLS